ncbi:MAG TPA: SRPBCC family protein [Kribbellaceae bacterium]|nr:SRPBCC family protein [Kribbellaceae bacterium]
MTVQAESTSVRKDIVVKASPERAFTVFTEQMGTWWPAEHHVLRGDGIEMLIEPSEGGRMYDVNAAGEECTWGRVLTWEPPHTFAFHWLIGPDFSIPEPDAPASRITVTFTPVEDGRTRVELVHDQLDQHGEGWQRLRDAVGEEDGWALTLRRFAAVLD